MVHPWLGLLAHAHNNNIIIGVITYELTEAAKEEELNQNGITGACYGTQ